MELLDEYYERFNVNFPLMEYQCATDKEINDLISECLEKNKTIEQLHPIDYRDKNF